MVQFIWAKDKAIHELGGGFQVVGAISMAWVGLELPEDERHLKSPRVCGRGGLAGSGVSSGQCVSLAGVPGGRCPSVSRTPITLLSVVFPLFTDYYTFPLKNSTSLIFLF